MSRNRDPDKEAGAVEHPHDRDTDSLRLLLIEDDADVRTLLEVMIEHDDRFELVGTAADGALGVSEAARLAPDAIVLDLELPELHGLEAIPLLRRQAPGSRIVVFSAFPDPFTLFDVVRLGADAYVDKATTWSELLPTLAAVCQPETASTA
jgi:DNA-binding NarL/FixJ family response regulator